MKLLFNVFKKWKHVVSSCKINSSKLNFHFFSYYVKFCTIWFYFVYLCLILYEKNCRYIIWINGFNVMSGVWSLYFSCKYIVFMYLIFVFHFNFVIINEKLNNFKINNLKKKLRIFSKSYQVPSHIKSCLCHCLTEHVNKAACGAGPMNLTYHGLTHPRFTLLSSSSDKNVLTSCQLFQQHASALETQTIWRMLSIWKETTIWQLVNAKSETEPPPKMLSSRRIWRLVSFLSTNLPRQSSVSSNTFWILTRCYNRMSLKTLRLQSLSNEHFKNCKKFACIKHQCEQFIHVYVKVLFQHTYLKLQL